MMQRRSVVLRPIEKRGHGMRKTARLPIGENMDHLRESPSALCAAKAVSEPQLSFRPIALQMGASAMPLLEAPFRSHSATALACRPRVG